MTEFENTTITNPDKIKEIKKAIDSGESAFKDVQPAKENKLPDNAAEVWKMDKEKQIERNCNNCKRQHTRYCPNSSECISLPNLPYFETDVVRLLEHDWDMHEKKIYELEAENDRLEMKLKQCIDEHSSMCDMNVGLMHDMENMKAENERICQNSVSHETFKLLMDEKAQEIAVLNRALELFFEYADHFIQSKQMYKDGYRSSQEYWKDKAKKELEEQDK